MYRTFTSIVANSIVGRIREWYSSIHPQYSLTLSRLPLLANEMSSLSSPKASTVLHSSWMKSKHFDGNTKPSQVLLLNIRRRKTTNFWSRSTLVSRRSGPCDNECVTTRNRNHSSCSQNGRFVMQRYLLRRFSD